VQADWNFDGSASWPLPVPGLDGKSSSLCATVSHRFEQPGTYFPAVKVQSHRDQARGARGRTVEDAGSVGVIVK
jgi:hypothetical protein